MRYGTINANRPVDKAVRQAADILAAKVYLKHLDFTEDGISMFVQNEAIELHEKLFRERREGINIERNEAAAIDAVIMFLDQVIYGADADRYVYRNEHIALDDVSFAIMNFARNGE